MALLANTTIMTDDYILTAGDDACALVPRRAVFLVGGVLLVAGTRWCGFVHGHAVGIGAILCFVHSGIIVGFYTPAIVAECCQGPQEHP